MTKRKIQVNGNATKTRPLTISYSQRTSGPVLRLKGEKQIADGLSDRTKLSQYAEVEVFGRDGGRSIFLRVPPLLDAPQIFIGYHGGTGNPLLVGAMHATQGNLTVIGPSQSGKSTLIGLIWYQLCRLGFFVAGVSLKDTDPILVASMQAGVEAPTQSHTNGHPCGGCLGFLSLKPGEPTQGLNFLAQDDAERPLSIRAGELLLALGQGGSEKDPTRRYFEFSQLALLLSGVDWGTSFRELYANLKALKLDRDTRYATSALFHEIAQLAAIEGANLPTGHRANIELVEWMKKHGALYISACYQDVGPVAIVWAALMIKAIVSAKRKLDPSKDTLIWIFIDEAQLFPLPFLTQLVAQCAGSGIRLLLAYHAQSQFKDDWETLCMTQVQIIFGAAPGSLTAEYIQNLFGTKKEYVPSFSNIVGTANGTTESPHGGVAVTATTSVNRGVTITEREVPRHGPNETAALNRDIESFVYYQQPVAELAQWPAIIAKRAGLHIEPEEIKRLTRKAVYENPHAFLPGKKREALALPPISEALKQKRDRFLETFRRTAVEIRKTLA